MVSTKYAIVYFRSEDKYEEVVGKGNLKLGKDIPCKFTLEQAIQTLENPLYLPYVKRNGFDIARIVPILKEGYGNAEKLYKLKWAEVK